MSDRHFEPPPDAFHFESPDGVVLLWLPAQGIVAARALGFVTGEVASAAYAAIDAMPSTPLEGFLDLCTASGFDWSARMRVFRWNVRHVDPKMRFDLLIPSRFERSTRVLSHLLGDRARLHSEPMTFDAAYGLSVRRKTRASLRPPRGHDVDAAQREGRGGGKPSPG
jgi:hypothetical protein